MVDGRPSGTIHTFVAPGEFKIENLPPQIQQFFKNPGQSEERRRARLFLAPFPNGFFSRLMGVLFCGFLALVFSGAVAAFLKERKVNWGGAIMSMVIAALFIWLTVYAFEGLIVRATRASTRNPRYGSWVLESGILARFKPRQFIYLPWGKISAMTEVIVYQSDQAKGSLWTYPAVCVTLEENGGLHRHYFSGACLGLTSPAKIGAGLINVTRYELGGTDGGPFRTFKAACSEFKPIQKPT